MNIKCTPDYLKLCQDIVDFRLIGDFCCFEKSYVLPFKNLGKACILLLLIIISSLRLRSLSNSRFGTNEAELVELSDYVSKVALIEHNIDESWQFSCGILFNLFTEYMT